MAESAIGWGAVQAALRQWVIDALADDTQAASDAVGQRIAWRNQNAIQLGRPFATLSVIAANAMGSIASRRYSVPILERITVANVAEQEYAFTIREGFGLTGRVEETELPFSYIAQPGDDAEAIRDGLIADVLASRPTDPAWPGVGADPEDDASLLLAGTEAHPAWNVEPSPSADLTRETVSEALREHTFEATELVVRVQVETDSIEPAQHARGYAARCRSALGFRTVRSVLRRSRITFVREDNPLDLSSVTNGAWVSRVAQDFRFHVGASLSTDVPWIRTAQPPQTPAALATA